MARDVDFGFMARGADAASVELKRQPFPGAVLVYRFPTFGVHTFDPEDLPAEIQYCLPGHAIKQILGDTGAGKEEPVFYANLTKRWNTLVGGDWSARGTGEGTPRMTEKSAAITVYARMKGISPDAATAIYEGKAADNLGVTWDAARRKAFLGKFAGEIAAERGRTAEQEF